MSQLPALSLRVQGEDDGGRGRRTDGSGSLCALNNQTRTVGRTKDEIDSCRPYLTEEQFITVSQAERIFICIWPRPGEEEEEEEEKDYDYCGMNRAVRLFFCVPLFSGRCVFSCCDLAWHYARQLLLGGLGRARFLGSQPFFFTHRDNQRNNPREARTDTIRVIITHTHTHMCMMTSDAREHHFGERNTCRATRNDHRLRQG
jgi:hypothetical protein